MLLLVHVIEARGLRARDPDELSDPYVKVEIGKRRFKTEVIRKNLNPVWEEQFTFWVRNLNTKNKLVVSVLHGDNNKFLGYLKLPLKKVVDAENLTLGDAWYELQPKKKTDNRVCGEIRLGLSFSHNNSSDTMPSSARTSTTERPPVMDKLSDLSEIIHSSSSSGHLDLSNIPDIEVSRPFNADESQVAPIVDIYQEFLKGKSIETLIPSNKQIGSSEEFENGPLSNNEECDNQNDDTCSISRSFSELIKCMESKDEGNEMPGNLPGGVVVDKSYAFSPEEMNALLFAPTSEFVQSLQEVQGISDVQLETWHFEDGSTYLKRTVTYTRPPSKLIKAIKAIEDQIYLKADGKHYAVLASVGTPDAPFGSCFKTEILYCIMPGPELPDENSSCHLVISWRMNFLQSTMMKSMIENGAKQGLNEGFSLFADKLSNFVKLVDIEGTGSSKEKILASLQTEQEPKWKISYYVFGSFTSMFCVCLGLCIFMHIILQKTNIVGGLEFFGLDLPDSFMEILVCGLLVLQGQYVWNRIRRFFHAWRQGGKDHGIKAQGDGWILTVALIDGSSISAVDQSDLSDPYVVLTCNGKTRTSSIKFQTANPQWNEIFEFDATCDPPSRMEVDVYDYGGPYNECALLGHFEINFVKSNLSDLSDIWIPLNGKSGQATESKLHLRIFLDNTRGNEVVGEYLTKMEKEVGRKINLRSPQANIAFQKLFGLPPEEFLINDYSCYLKRKMPLQGRLFLSPRIIGFHANLFGHKTKFFLLWEDIYDIKVVRSALASVGSPSLMITLLKGRGVEAKHGAKTVDMDGRLKFHFKSFVYFNGAYRTIMALWRARSLSPEQKVKYIEESTVVHSSTEESGPSLCAENCKLSKVFSASLHVSAKSLMEMFEGGTLEHKIMRKIGFTEYSAEPWQQIKNDLYQRNINFKFDKNMFGDGGEVITTQQRSCSADKNEWLVEETTMLQGLFLADYFKLQAKYQIESPTSKPTTCDVHVYLGISWLKRAKDQKKVSKNVMSHSTLCFKEIFRLAEKEISALNNTKE